tara:strand:- start:7157 stop:7342 length:186 start_codon:yes stop_codon:yes gene_type:complete
MSAAASVQAMIDNLEALKADAEKHDKGQKAAGTRVRTAMQGIKADAQTLRGLVLADQKKGG